MTGGLIMSFDLGGFAEDEDAVDGDYESFNYCLAENYYFAMLGEEWDLIGDASESLIDNIVHWLSFYSDIKDYDTKKIVDGSFITYKGRTFIDAIIADKRVDLAETYIRLGVEDIRLYILFMLNYKDDMYDIDHPMHTINYVYHGSILNIYNYDDRDQLITFLSAIFIELDRIYSDLESDLERKEFLEIVRANVKGFKFSSKIGKIRLTDVCSEVFVKKLINS